MTTDPIADMLTRIRNAALAGKAETSIPYSKVKEGIARILKANGFITGFKLEGKEPLKTIEIQLNNDREHGVVLSRISKPGRRIYAKASELPVVLGGKGLVIVSTSSGLMSSQEARKRRLGGELICKVY